MQFSSGQRNLAIRALDEAEERTLQYYCIPPHRWQHLNYDMVTSKDREWEPLPEDALAQLQLLCPAQTTRKAAGDFYRIQLNDPSILFAAHRERLVQQLYPFLVYILTHEMVHLVRLSMILAGEQELQLSPDLEESRVQGISFRILSRDPDIGVLPILSKFCVDRAPAQPAFVRPAKD